MTLAQAFPEADCLHVWGSVTKESFMERMRFHQSWIRHYKIPALPGPNLSARRALYGNTLGETDGFEGKNFLTPDITELARKRFPLKKWTTKSSYLYGNMLGSQAMCFNLFGPLARNEHHELATSLLRRLEGFPEDACVSSICFEYAPDQTLHLNDGTSFDAFIEYERPGGRHGFVGVETKLIEKFTQTTYHLNQRYFRWIQIAEWWQNPVTEPDFSAKQYNQLWRNHLVAFSMLHQEKPAYDEGFAAVVYPTGNEHCGDAIKAYRKHLLPAGDQTLLEWRLKEDVLAAWKPLITDEAHQKWITDFEQRYIDLSLSETAWQEFRKSHA